MALLTCNRKAVSVATKTDSITLSAMLMLTALLLSAPALAQAQIGEVDLQGEGCLPVEHRSGSPTLPLTGDYLGQRPPGETPQLFAPGVVSTCKEHSAAMFTPDGTEMYFGRMFPAAIYFMQRTDGGWTEPEVAPFSGQYNDLYPFLSADGQTLAFSSNRPAESGGTRVGRQNPEGHV
jgi:hypothetical protein